LLGGFPVSASSTRTAVAEHAGSHSQVTALASAALVVVLLGAAPAATSALPVAALAAVVVVAAARLIDVHGVVWLLRVNRTDGLLCLAATTGVVFIGVLEGIVIAAALSMIAFVSGSWRPYRAELGHVVGVRGYHDLTRHPEAQRIPEIVIVRFDAPLFFANAGIFGHFVRSTVERAGPRTRVVVLAAEPITDIDTTGFEELERVDDYLRSKGAELVIAELKGPVKDQLERYDAGGRFGPQRLMPTVGAAVDRITGRLRTDLAPPEPPHDATG
jgi:MFS superfamily sulfate permease-like transporter